MKNKFDSLFFAISCSEMRIIMSFTFLNQLPSPAEIRRDFPLSEELKQLKKEKIKTDKDTISI